MRPDVSQHERIGASRRPRADLVLRAKSDLVRTRGSYERLADDNRELNTVWPVRPNPGTNRAYQIGIDREDGSLARFTSVCAPLVYRGDRLPAELYGNVFVAEPAANLVSRIVLTDDGTTLRARKAYDRGEFLASTDERFRPVYLSNAPDGTLYIADMYRGIIEHRISITSTFAIRFSRASWTSRPASVGSIASCTRRRDSTRLARLAHASPGELVATLSHPNGWRRDTAQRLLVERGAKAVVTALAISRDARRSRGPACMRCGHSTARRDSARNDYEGAGGRISRCAYLGDPHRRTVAGRANHPILAAVLKRMDDPDRAVHQQLAASLGALPGGPREAAAVALLERYADDPVVMDAALSGLRGSEADVLERLMREKKSDAPTQGGN